MTVFPLFYFPPIPWFVGALQESEILLDIYQPYRKQRYFSRMEIRGPNQVVRLTIPIERRSKQLPLIHKNISYAERWRIQHWRSLVFSYKNSPYFPYYSDMLESYFRKKFPPSHNFCWKVLNSHLGCLAQVLRYISLPKALLLEQSLRITVPVSQTVQSFLQNGFGLFPTIRFLKVSIQVSPF